LVEKTPPEALFLPLFRNYSYLWLRRRYARPAKCRQVCFCFRRFVSLQTDGPASRMQYFPCAAVYKDERY